MYRKRSIVMADEIKDKTKESRKIVMSLYV